jgi:hypothetical protein
LSPFVFVVVKVLNASACVKFYIVQVFTKPRQERLLKKRLGGRGRERNIVVNSVINSHDTKTIISERERLALYKTPVTSCSSVIVSSG